MMCARDKNIRSNNKINEKKTTTDGDFWRAYSLKFYVNRNILFTELARQLYLFAHNIIISILHTTAARSYMDCVVKMTNQFVLSHTRTHNWHPNKRKSSYL